MSSTSTYIYTFIGYLPDLISLGIALTMLMSMAQPGRDRRLGVIGIGVILASTVIRFGFSMLQHIMLAREASGGIGQSFALYSTIHMLLNIAAAAGLLMLVFALCRATKAQPQR